MKLKLHSHLATQVSNFPGTLVCGNLSHQTDDDVDDIGRRFWEASTNSMDESKMETSRYFANMVSHNDGATPSSNVPFLRNFS
eukprot:1311892-Pleurochrysis_carterae.AAC.1